MIPSHAYSLIDAVEVETKKGEMKRMIKIRNPWAVTEWEGEGCETDTEFWNNILPTQNKINFLKNSTIKNDGVFFMKFEDYCKYFIQTHVSFL